MNISDTRKLSSRVATAVISTLAFGCAHALEVYPAEPSIITPFVRIGSIDFTFLAPFDSINFPGAYRPFRARMLTEDYLAFRQEVRDSVVNPLLSTDVRCNSLATAATRSTTSRSSLMDRYLASQQLFGSIAASQGAAGVAPVLAISQPKLLNGKYLPVFPVAYADGSGENWAVEPGVLGRLLFLENFNTPPVGDGVIKGCPLIMRN